MLPVPVYKISIKYVKEESPLLAGTAHEILTPPVVRSIDVLTEGTVEGYPAALIVVGSETGPHP